MKHKFWWSLLVILIAVAALVGWRLYYNKMTPPVKSRSAGAAVAVAAVRPEKRNLRDLPLFTGSLKPWSRFDVAPKVSGRLTALNAELGDRIDNGTLIAQIDDEEYRREVEQAQADLDITIAQLEEARITLLRQREFRRQQALGKATSAAMQEAAESAMKSQEATVAMKTAEVKRREAMLQSAKIRLNDTRIKPEWCDSNCRFVGERFVDAGALLAVNQPILSLMEIDRMKAEINVIEKDYPHLFAGQHATIFTDAYPDREFTGRIVNISKLVQANSRQALVELEIPNPDRKLAPGMFVRVYLEFARHDNATVVPRSALVRRDGRECVFLLDAAAGVARQVEVVSGIIDGKDIEIVSPEIKMPVITLGSHLLADGVPVRVPAEFQVPAAENKEVAK